MATLPMSEDQLYEAIRNLVQTLHLRIYHTRDSRRSYSGFPDLVVVGQHGILFRELKKAGEDPTAEQRAWLDALTGAGADAGVWRPADLHANRISTQLQQLRRPPGFTCPRCGRTSYHPEDLRQGYCGACHDFTGSACFTGADVQHLANVIAEATPPPDTVSDAGTLARYLLAAGYRHQPGVLMEIRWKSG